MHDTIHSMQHKIVKSKYSSEKKTEVASSVISIKPVIKCIYGAWTFWLGNEVYSKGGVSYRIEINTHQFLFGA